MIRSCYSLKLLHNLQAFLCNNLPSRTEIEVPIDSEPDEQIEGQTDKEKHVCRPRDLAEL